jgi:hypothetical protein
MKCLRTGRPGASIAQTHRPTRRTLLCLALVSTAFAQTPSPTPTPAPQQPVNSPRPIWRCNMPGGTYQVLLSAMVGVSSHEYVVDGAARVTEVNVDTGGQLAVRFYYIEPAVTAGPSGIGAATIGKVQSLLTEAAERSGTDAWKKVVKSYPVTTHARTVEYRVADRESLNKIFASASRCLTTGRPEEVNISE